MADQTLEIDEALQAEIVKGVGEALVPQIEAATEAAATKAAEAVFAKLDAADKKDLGDEEAAEDAADNKLKSGEVDERFKAVAKMSKERRFFAGIRALQNGDYRTLELMNDYAKEMVGQRAVDAGIIDVSQKANYANEATAADGQVLVPDPDFNTTVYENLPKYGVTFSDANVRTTDRNAVYALSLDSGLTMYQTAEAGVKQGGKLAFSRKLVSLLKYAVIVPATEELSDDAIVDYWNIVTNEVSRAYALQADTIVFTDSSMGILHTTGIITRPVSGAGTTITWDDLLAAEGSVEDGLDTSNFKWYLRRETWFRLAQLKASGGSGTYLAASMMAGWNPNPNSPATPWGTPVQFTRILPKSTEVSSNGGFCVYGDLTNYNFYTKNGLQIKMLTEATVKDAGGSDFNLATQDGIAMRVVARMLGVLPKGNAGKFVVVGTGTVS